MKKIDVTTPVMKKVVQFEVKRTRWWLGRFISTLVLFLVLAVGSTYFVTRDFFDEEMQLFLSLYTEDVETLQDIWDGIVAFVWDTIPHEVFFFLLGVVITSLVFLIITKRTRSIMKKRLKEVQKYSESRK